MDESTWAGAGRVCLWPEGVLTEPFGFLQASSTEQIASEDVKEAEESQGLNGNGNGNGNGVAYSSSLNGAVSATEGVSNNVVSSDEDDTISRDIQGYLSADEAGHLETAAQEALYQKEQRKKKMSLDMSGSEGDSDEGKGEIAEKRTPYKEPGGRWGRFKTYSTFQRTWEIWSFAFKFFFKLWLVNQKWTYKKNGMTEDTVKDRKRELAVWLREGLVKLGPTFIKIGQQFSTRVDVLSPEFIQELEKLQDSVPPFSSKKAVEIIESGLGKPVNEIFEEFEMEPIAAASLGQVHIAKVKGEQVVVKVQRPGLKELFDIDLKNVRVLAQWLQNVDPKSDGAARDWVAIYDECSRILYQEIDYRLEGKNADLFRENFKDTTWIKVPKVLWEYSTSEVLTLEYVPGIKINRAKELDKAGVDREILARRTVESYLQQLLTYGFFHADPHPGNIAVDAVDGGRLIYYDFGMMGTSKSDYVMSELRLL